MSQRYHHYPWVGSAVFLVPVALAGIGVGIALTQEATALRVAVGVVIAALAPIVLLPVFYRREVVITADIIRVKSGVPLFTRSERHPRESVVKVRWEMNRPSRGTRSAKSFRMTLVGPSRPVVVPIRDYDVEEARQLGMTLGVPVERVVDGEVAERWNSDGKWDLP